MAHNLEVVNGQASFFTVKEKAWHGLGTIIDNNPTLEEAIKLAKLDYVVEKQPMYIEFKKEQQLVPDKFATVRNDTGAILGVVGNQYQIVQNMEAFSFFDFLEDAACFETGGVLGKGEISWLSCKLPNHFSIAGKNDLIENYLFLTTSHDGSLALQAMFTPVRVVCNNTLSGALKQNSNKISIRHTRSAEQKIKQAHQLMGIVNQLQQEMEDVYKAMYKTKITDQKVKDLILSCIAPKVEVGKADDLKIRMNNKLTEIMDYYTSHETQTNITGSVYGVYNALTGYFQNNDKTEDERKMKGILTGDRFLQRSFEKCVCLVK